ncbi:MAG: hypothetical protein ACYDHH_06995 [Solirubrobacteraceae bacterium]
MSQGARTAANTARQAGNGFVRAIRAFRALEPERRMAAIASVLLFFALFLPWYQRTFFIVIHGKPTPASDTSTGWGAFSFVEAAVLLVAVGVLTLLFQRAEGRAFHLPGGDGWIITVAGGWTSCLVVWRIFDKQGATSQGQYVNSSGIEWGIFVALAIAAFLTYSGARVRAAHDPEPPLPGDDGYKEAHATPGKGSGFYVPAAAAASPSTSAGSAVAEPTPPPVARGNPPPLAPPPVPANPSAAAARSRARTDRAQGRRRAAGGDRRTGWLTDGAQRPPEPAKHEHDDELDETVAERGRGEPEPATGRDSDAPPRRAAPPRAPEPAAPREWDVSDFDYDRRARGFRSAPEPEDHDGPVDDLHFYDDDPLPPPAPPPRPAPARPGPAPRRPAPRDSSDDETVIDPKSRHLPYDIDASEDETVIGPNSGRPYSDGASEDETLIDPQRRPRPRRDPR